MQTVERIEAVKPIRDTATLAELIKRLQHLDIAQTTRLTFDISTEVIFVSANGKKKGKWQDTPIFGMWKNRVDMENPSEYIRKIREPRHKW